jgi:hypothetical protein
MLLTLVLWLLLIVNYAPVLAADQVGYDHEAQTSLDDRDLVEYNGTDLIEQAGLVNGREIIFQGEVIGDIMNRKDGCWINVLNHGTAIGVWISAEQRALITIAGRYGVQGDQVKIIGRFDRACPMHGGDLDIHASSVEIISPGFIRPSEINLIRLVLAAVLLLSATGSLVVFQKGRLRQQRRKPVL